MRITYADFIYLRWGALSLVIASLLSFAIGFFSQQRVTMAEQQQQLTQQKLAQLQSEISQANSQLDDQKIYETDYQSLLNRNIIGVENRLALLENLEKISLQHGIGPLTYHIDTQKDFMATPALDTGHFKIYQSATSLQLTIRHEQQLFDFLIGLNEQLPGQFLLQQCTVSRIQFATAMPLAADCSGAWLTFQHRPEP